MQFNTKVQEFLAQPNFMVLSEHNPDKTIHSTIVWYKYENGVFRFSTTTDRVKYRNLTNNPECTMLIPNTENMYQFVQIQGKVSDTTTEGGHDFIDELAKKYLGEDKYPHDPQRQDKRVTFTVTPDNYFSNGV